MNRIDAAADIIASARRQLVPLETLDATVMPRSEDEGYRVQDAVHARLCADQGALGGHKIGCTSTVMQRYLGISHPCAGRFLASACHASGVRLIARDFVRLGVECEIAVRLGADIAPQADPFTGNSVAEHVAAYVPAIEIVDERYVDWRAAGVPMLVADDFFAAGCVLGDAVPRAALPDLLQVRGRALINGTVAGEGTAADVMGHPHNALAWLANHFSAMGKTLKQGELVLTGSLVQTIWLTAGDAVVMEYGAFGTIGFALA